MSMDFDAISHPDDILLPQVMDLTGLQIKAIELLAGGMSTNEVGEEIERDGSTIRRWRQDPKFANQLELAILNQGASLRAERIRLAKKMLRKIGTENTKADPVDILRYIQSETDGAKGASSPEMQRKLKSYEVLLYLVKHEICNDCRRKIGARIIEIAAEGI